MSEFQFITTSNDPKLALQDVESRRLIRTTATRATRSHKAQELSEKHHVQSDVVRETSQRGGMTKFRTKPTKRKPARKSVKIQVALAPATIASSLKQQVSVWDPVVSPLGGQAWDLLHYYRYLFRANSWAINAKRDWFAFVIEDQAATHATLSFISLNRDLENDATPSITTLHYRSKAMQLVRRRLDSDTAFLDDSLIGAIALLALTEGLDGHSSSSEAHVEALMKLVTLRGGFSKLHKNEALCRLVAWADLCHTSTFSNKPQLPQALQLPGSDLDPGVSLSNGIEVRSFQRSVQAVMFPEMYNLVKLLAAIPQYSPTEKTSAGERQKTSRLIYYMNQLLLSIHSGDTGFCSDATAKLTKILSYAVHLYISLVLRQMPRRTKAIIERANRLKSAFADLQNDNLEDTDLQSLSPPIILWAQTLHFCSLLPHERAGSVLNELRQIVGDLQIRDVQSWEDYLGQISWVKGYCEDDLKKVIVTSNASPETP